MLIKEFKKQQDILSTLSLPDFLSGMDKQFRWYFRTLALFHSQGMTCSGAREESIGIYHRNCFYNVIGPNLKITIGPSFKESFTGGLNHLPLSKIRQMHFNLDPDDMDDILKQVPDMINHWEEFRKELIVMSSMLLATSIAGDSE